MIREVTSTVILLVMLAFASKSYSNEVLLSLVTAVPDQGSCSPASLVPRVMPNQNAIVGHGSLLIRNPGYGGADPALPITNLKPEALLIIDADGNALESIIKTSTGSPKMDQIILIWARKIIFEAPYCKSGQVLRVVLPLDLSPLAVES